MGRWLYKFDEHPTRILRMNKIDTTACCPATWSFKEQAHAAFAHCGAGNFDIGNAVGKLLNSGATLVEESCDSRLGGEGCQKLELHFV